MVSGSLEMMNLLFIDWQPDPEAFKLGQISVRWYSMLWVVGLLLAVVIVKNLYRKQHISGEKFDPLFVYCFLGVLLGPRLGHCLFYEPGYFLTSAKGLIEMIIPIRFLPGCWEWKYTGYTGLASHGGAIGLFIGILLYARKYRIALLQVLDNIAIATPLTACCIRLGNLMNSEIVGTRTDVAWGFVFRANGESFARHPAQLYEALVYLLIFIVIILIYKYKGEKTIPAGSGFYFGFCLTTIFIYRFFIEFLKEEQESFEEGMTLDMGQLLSIPFVLIGLYFMCRKQHKKITNNKNK